MTTNQELRKLVETVLDDWISTYASEFCAPGRVKQAKERIKDGGGTIAYVTDMRESLSSGIGALLDRIDRLEAENEAQRKLLERAQVVLLQHHSDPGYREARIAALVAITDHLKGKNHG